MCGIVGTKNPKLLKELLEKVYLRGTRALSVSALNLTNYELIAQFTSTSIPEIEKVFEEFNTIKGYNELLKKDTYYIAHTQSPTSINFSFHPARFRDKYLWHNGQIDSQEHQKYTGKPWDTQLLLEMIAADYLSALDSFKGSFACVYLQKNKGLYIFRNAIAPLYYSDDGTICSVSFDNAKRIEVNKVYAIEPTIITVVGKFNNTYNPFGV